MTELKQLTCQHLKPYIVTCTLAGKEKEVLAMENGGNKKVNIIWEANLARAGGRKPATGADLSSRERYIRDKYERRKFYDPNALADFQDSGPSFDEIGRGANAPDGFADFGPPAEGMVSDAAKMRAEKKKKKNASRNKSIEGSTAANFNPMLGDVGKKSRTKKPEAGPEQVVDLLDLGGEGPTLPTSGTSQTSGDFADFFVGAATSNGIVTPDVDSTKLQPTVNHSKIRSDGRTGSKATDQETTRKTQQQDIMSMYGPSTSSASVTGERMAGSGMAYNMTANPADMMAMMQRMQQMSMTPQQSQMTATGMNVGMNPQQQIQTHQPGSGQSKSDIRLAMHQNLMMQQMQVQMQQQQQMQRMSQQGQVVTFPNSGQQQGAVNPQMMQAMMNANSYSSSNNMVQGGQMTPNAYMMGMNQNAAMAMNPGLMGQNNMISQQEQQQPQMNQLGGIALGSAPNMAGLNGAAKSTLPEKKDPFANFGVNAFR